VKVKTYIVQIRRDHGGTLQNLGLHNAVDEVHAILQAARILARMGEHVVEIIATPQY